jgi:hypothetical protein
MLKHEFALFIKRMGDFYERGKEPRQSAMDAWFEKIQHIPSEAIRWIESKIQDECDSFPHNIAKTVNEYNMAWQQANPDKHAPEHHFDCPDCDHGLIRAFKDHELSGVRYGYAFKCSKCRQLRLDYPVMSRSELVAQGYVFTH